LPHLSAEPHRRTPGRIAVTKKSTVPLSIRPALARRRIRSRQDGLRITE
jgi:hypothetical protein